MQLDHVAVAGTTLSDATATIESALGVAMQPGGEHVAFGTHNSLLGLDDGLYVEAIAINPAAPCPAFPRWFDLDRFTGPARLTNWICQTNDMDHTLTQLAGRAGTPVAVQRGDLRWQMAVPENGRLPFDNLHPALISWQSPIHPSAMLKPSGCALRRLIVVHPNATVLHDALDPVLNDTRIVFETGAAALIAEFDTPHGPRVLQ